jgi:phage regulator Rha-like protein
MFDFDLAQLYHVETRALKQAVRRNMESFPDDFMFRLTKKEWKILTSQIVMFKKGQGKHPKYLPYAFTEQGVAMLSSVLKSKRARLVNIAIMRAFVQMRKLLETHKELAAQLKKLESRLDQHDHAIQNIFEAIRQLMEQPNPPRKKIGFKIGKEK